MSTALGDSVITISIEGAGFDKDGWVDGAELGFDDCGALVGDRVGLDVDGDSPVSDGTGVGVLVVGRNEGLFEGIAVGTRVGLLDVGEFVGAAVGFFVVGAAVGLPGVTVGTGDGRGVGWAVVGLGDGRFEGRRLGEMVGWPVGGGVGRSEGLYFVMDA